MRMRTQKRHRYAGTDLLNDGRQPPEREAIAIPSGNDRRAELDDDAAGVLQLLAVLEGRPRAFDARDGARGVQV